MGKVEGRNQTLRLAWYPCFQPILLHSSRGMLPSWQVMGYAAMAQPSASSSSSSSSSHELARCPAQPGSAHQLPYLLPPAVSSTGQPAPGIC